MIVPNEPYKILYLPKLARKYLNPSVTAMLRIVAIMVPGLKNFHLFVVEGAYL